MGQVTNQDCQISQLELMDEQYEQGPAQPCNPSAATPIAPPGLHRKTSWFFVTLFATAPVSLRFLVSSSSANDLEIRPLPLIMFFFLVFSSLHVAAAAAAYNTELDSSRGKKETSFCSGGRR
jgi:hypothetical protein